MSNQPTPSNKLLNTSIKGFLDVSGNISILNDFSLKLFHSNFTTPSLSIDPYSFNVFDDYGIPTSIPNTNLSFLKDVSFNIQSQLNNLNQQIIGLSDVSNLNVVGNLVVNGNTEFFNGLRIQGNGATGSQGYLL